MKGAPQQQALQTRMTRLRVPGGTPRSRWTICLALTVAGAVMLAMLLSSTVPGKAQAKASSGISAPTTQILCVDDGGGTTGSPCTNSTAFTHIQDAINAASTGDEVRVAAGTYVTNTGTTVVNLDRGITLTGGYPGGPSGWTTPGNETLTVIDGQSARDGVTVAYFGGGTVVAQNYSVVNSGIVLDVAATLSNNMPVRTRTLNQSSGTVGGSAPITVTNAYTVTYGTQGDTGRTDILPGAQLNITGPGSLNVQDARAINNYGTATWSGAITINMHGGATFNNRPNATFTILNNQAMASGGTFNNFGTLIKSSTGDTTIALPTAFNNSGAVQINNGRLLFGVGSSTGTYNVAAGAILGGYFGDTYIYQPSSAITGAGTFESGQSLAVISGTFTLPVVNMIGGQVNFDSVGANTASSVSVLTQTNGTLGGSRTISVTNVVNWSSDFMSDSGHTDILPGAHLNINAQVGIEAGRVINNYGTTTLSGAGSIFLSNGGHPGTFNNRSRGIINILNNGRIGDEGLSSGTLNNFGTINRSGSSGTALLGFEVGTFTNQGLVDVQSGTLEYDGNVPQTAGITRMSGGNIQVDAPFSFPLQGGRLEGSGTVTGSVNNSGGTLSPGLNGPGLITITSDYTQGAGGTLSTEIGGHTPISQFDVLDVSGVATLGGTLGVSLINGFTPSNGDTFQVMNYASHSGAFASLTGPTFTPIYNSTNLTLCSGTCGGTPQPTPTFTHTPIPTSTGEATFTAGPTNTRTHTPLPTRTPTITVTVVGCPPHFSDVHTGDYFYEAVQHMFCAGVISGYSDNSFRPYNNTIRGQICKIITLFLGMPMNTTGGPHFSDVPTSNPFYPYIETAYNAGIISGYSDGTFRWQNNVSRGQICKIVVNGYGWSIYTPSSPTYSDVPVGSPFYTYVETANYHGIISGYSDGTFRPGNNATRGQVCKIVYSGLNPLELKP